MTKKLPKRGLPPMHPGELLREEILPALDRPKTEIAKLLGVSRQTLYDILEEKQPVTPVMALRLGKLCGNGPDLWLNLQKRYDLQRARAGAWREDQGHSDVGGGVKRGAPLQRLRWKRFPTLIALQPAVMLGFRPKRRIGCKRGDDDNGGRTHPVVLLLRGVVPGRA